MTRRQALVAGRPLIAEGSPGEKQKERTEAPPLELA